MLALMWAPVWLLLGTGLAPAFSYAAREDQTKLQGTWTTTRAVREGKPADDIVGNRLSMTGNRFEIRTKDGKILYGGTFSADPTTKPATFDFEHTKGILKGTKWKGIFALDGDTLTTCDNGPDPNASRPVALQAKAGSGHILIIFKRVKP
jgi:uncharacterized protein (TIGR03067 family)